MHFTHKMYIHISFIIFNIYLSYIICLYVYMNITCKYKYEIYIIHIAHIKASLHIISLWINI